MATVTAFTAARSKAIEDNAIVDGTIVGNDLILKRFNGLNPVNAGNVRGPQGDQGPMGITSIPTGALQPFAGSDAPEGWLLCDGEEYLITEYQDLFNVIGTEYGLFTPETFRVPNFANKVPVGRSITKPLGHEAGTENQNLTIEQLPAHYHSINHNHPTFNTGSWNRITGGLNGLNRLGGGTTDYYVNNLPISINVPNFTGLSGPSAGVGNSHNNMQPYIAVNYLIKT